jgi:hypothetical protein
MKSQVLQTMGGALTLVLMTGCGGSYMSPSSTTPSTATPVLSQLHTITPIGSTVDTGSGAGAGDSNPYGLYIAPITAGNITLGDLVVCNFNDASGVQGNGTTIEDLHPTPGSTPTRIAQSSYLKGCAALSPDPSTGNIWASAYTANDNPIFTPSGVLQNSLATAYKWTSPWGEMFASPTPPSSSSGSGYNYATTSSTTTSPKSWYVSNAQDGSIVQVAVTSTGFQYYKIATGFPVNLTSQYGILAPAGLSYNPTTDTLYIVSSASNSVVAFKAVSTIPAGGIVVNVNTTTMALTFSGPNASQASVVYSGTPLNYPVSSALLYNGDLVVGNTGDNNLVEINPTLQTIVGELNVDTAGSPGAIFGIAASTATSAATQKIYFNDDDLNKVVEVSQ